MLHISDLSNANLAHPTLVTIGVFDGVHRGHQHLIRQLVAEGQRLSYQVAVLTFFPHPDIVVRKLEGRYYLTRPDERARLLTNLGVDVVVTHPFTDELRQVRADVFADQLHSHLRMAQLWVGASFAMGYRREGNVPFLRAYGESRGFTVHEIELLGDDGDRFSSMAIREALKAGEVERAREALGRPYTLTGQVVHGEGRGHKIGYPTANMDVWSEQILPANGIYAGWATLRDDRFMAVTNVGIRPTFDGTGYVTVEPYLLDFDRDIYGQELTISFERRLRPEQRFGSIQELIAQIGRDVDAGRAYLSAQSA